MCISTDNNPISHVGPDYSDIVHSIQIHMRRKNTTNTTGSP